MRRDPEPLTRSFKVDGIPVTVTWKDGAVTVDGPTEHEASELVDAMNAISGTDDYPYPPGVWVPDAFRAAATEGRFRNARSLAVAADAFASYEGPPSGWQFSWPRRNRPPAIWFHVAVHVKPLRDLVRRASCAPLSARKNAAKGTLVEGVFPMWMLAMTNARWWLAFAVPFVVLLAFVSERSGALGVGFGMTALPVLAGGPFAMAMGARLLRRIGL